MFWNIFITTFVVPFAVNIATELFKRWLDKHNRK